MEQPLWMVPGTEQSSPEANTISTPRDTIVMVSLFVVLIGDIFLKLCWNPRTFRRLRWKAASMPVVRRRNPNHYLILPVGLSRLLVRGQKLAVC